MTPRQGRAEVGNFFNANTLAIFTLFVEKVENMRVTGCFSRVTRDHFHTNV